MKFSKFFPESLLLAAFFLVACGSNAPQEQTQKPTTSETATQTAQTTAEFPTLKELYVTESKPEDNVDSIAVYHGSDDTHLTIITAKAGDKLVVFNAATGELVREVGSEGKEAGQMDRPNGVAVVDDLCLVVERDNRRVQLFSLPSFEHVGFIGEADLQKPYGLTVFKGESGAYELYVTDDFEIAADATDAEQRYTERIKHYRFTNENGIQAELVKTFGDPSGEGRLFVVESIMADPASNRLFIADEEGETKGVKVYNLDGEYTGVKLENKHFKGQPEGLAIYGKYLVTTDQQPDVSVFRLFDLQTLQPVHAFVGEVTANTDGIAVSATPMPNLSKGALWAIHDDQALVAFDWSLIEPAKSEDPHGDH